MANYIPHLFNQRKLRNKPSLEMINSSLDKTYNELIQTYPNSEKTFNDNWNSPYTKYQYGQTFGVGRRIAMEIKRAQEEDRLDEIVT